MTTFYWYPKCSTCRKAKQWLDEHNVQYETVNMIEDVPSKEELLHWMTTSSLSRRRFFNTSGQLYRASGLKNQLDDMTDEQCAEELAKDGMMIRRPILVCDDHVTFGFKEDAFSEVLGLN